MAKIMLTDRKIQNLEVKETEYSIGDGDNLNLTIKPNGSKLWRFSYTHPKTKKRVKVSFGKYPHISLSRAREKAREYHALLNENLDPQEYLAEQAQIVEKQSMMLDDFALKWLEWHANNQDLMDKTKQKIGRMLE
ncbi:hypothetical protein A4G19_14490 [Pasteurellaceae bacterium Macca]|nr:hypothetical protein [Pasteurellaceae bacterium Macca]MCK3656872.1 hypothetical protein [Pasteurellaceae bacterium Macca]